MELYDETTLKISKLVTVSYSTSFSFATSLMCKEHRNAIYAIYGFVRFADEIVDTFHNYNQKILLSDFEKDLDKAIKENISLNPILNSFQLIVKRYNIPREYIDSFLHSMRIDLQKRNYFSKAETDQYIYGSADVVGLMCLHVFCNNNQELLEELKYPAMRLGSAFQKVNFLRDLKADAEELGRNYFHHHTLGNLDENAKSKIIAEIESDFEAALPGIRKLPADTRIAVMVAYNYYRQLLYKLKRTPAADIKKNRIRISDFRKILIITKSMTLGKLNLL
jgi:15-cis-phytoene synthase